MSLIKLPRRHTQVVYSLLGKTEDEYKYFSRSQKEEALNAFKRTELQKNCRELGMKPGNIVKAKLVQRIIDSEGKMLE